MAGALEYCLLGPVEILLGRSAMTLPGGDPLAVLAMLLLEIGKIVPTEKLIEMLWEDHPIKTARVTLSNYIKDLKHAYAAAGFADPPIRRRGPGYLVMKDSGTLDLTIFRNLVRSAHEEARQQSWETAARILVQARGLRRGEPLADVKCEALTRVYRPLLELEYLEATEDWALAKLHLGHEREILPELRELAVDNPVREPTYLRLMEALYQDDQQAEALAVYRQIDRTLATELGIRPGPQLRQLHQTILDGKPLWDK